MTTTTQLVATQERTFWDFLQIHQFLGDAVSGFNNKLYKVRIPSFDQKKGKNGGFRVVYYIILDAKEVILLTIYAKSKQNDIKDNDVRRMLKQLDL